MRNRETRRLERELRALGRERYAPPPDLEARLLEQIPGEFRPARSSTWSFGRLPIMVRVGAVGVALAALVLIAFTLFAPGSVEVSLAQVLEPVLAATGSARGVHLVLDVREQDREEPGFIDLAGSPHRMEAWIRWPAAGGSENPDKGRIRVEKGGWTYVFDGTSTIYYRPGIREAYRFDGGSPRLELLWPAAWVKDVIALPKDGRVLDHVEASGEGRLLVHWPAPDLGPRQPAWFEDYEREVEIRWNLASKQLTGLRQWVVARGAKTLVRDLRTVEYLPDVAEATFAIDLPADVRYSELFAAPPEIDRLTSREAAERLWQAAIRGDWETVRYFVPSPATRDWIMRMRPIELRSLGEPFKSGAYPGVLIPYEVRYGSREGTTRHNIAMRNDNRFGRWIADGGI